MFLFPPKGFSPTCIATSSANSLTKMKIFNWVHRRFNSKGENDEKKNGESDKQFEDEKDVFERWGGGILTIGTFGYDPLKDQSHHHHPQQTNNFLYQETAVLAEDYEDDAHEEEEEEVEINVDDDEEEEEDDEEKPLVFGGYLEDLMEREEFGFEYMMMEKRARTTLADLFSTADHSEDKKQPLKKPEIAKTKPARAASFTKKLKLEEARPIHKLNQLMRRMLKRKIHPDIGVLNYKVSLVKNCDINDHASLLPTPDAII